MRTGYSCCGHSALHEIVYKMYAVALDIDMSDTEMKYQEIERNGYKFWFMTYKNEDLRNLQMWLIEPIGTGSRQSKIIEITALFYFQIIR